MGGSGGYSAFGRSSGAAAQRAFDDVVVAERARILDADVNQTLQDLLGDFNAIDREQIRSRLDEIDAALEDVEFEKLLYAGSVAKHTAIDGLSDVDALMVFDPAAVKGTTPDEIRTACAGLLEERLDHRGVESVTAGAMAITIRYSDGQEIQVLPALRRGNDAIDVPEPNGSDWVRTHPKRFREALTSANEQVSGKLVPSIKLLKSMVTCLPAQQQISGYHAESLAVEAAASFPMDRPRTLKHVLLHVVRHASERVLLPMRDVTGQSDAVDNSLGAASSLRRRLISSGLTDLHRRLSNATDADTWRVIVGGH